MGCKPFGLDAGAVTLGERSDSLLKADEGPMGPQL